MILTDRQLRQLGPELLDPFTPDAVQPASIDLRLGTSFRVFNRATVPHVDLASVPPADLITTAVDTELYMDVDGVVVDQNACMVIHPGQLVLGSTLERITVPPGLAMQLVGKSSLARLGLLPHVEAGWFDPGWEGVGTLEIVNLGAAPVILRPGLWICQSRWMHVDEYPEHLYGDAALGSHYQHSTGAEGSRYEGARA